MQAVVAFMRSILAPANHRDDRPKSPIQILVVATRIWIGSGGFFGCQSPWAVGAGSARGMAAPASPSVPIRMVNVDGSVPAGIGNDH